MIKFPSTAINSQNLDFIISRSDPSDQPTNTAKSIDTDFSNSWEFATHLLILCVYVTGFYYYLSRE